MTVDDLFKWHLALKNNMVLKKETLKLAWSRFTLTDGSKIDYGMGWEIKDLFGSTSIQHSGSITGFSAMEIYLPEEDVFVVTLSNGINKNTVGYSTIAACLATSKSIVREISLPQNIMDSYVGVYKFKLDQPSTLKVLKKAGKLYLHDSRAPIPWEMRFTSLTDFFCYEVFPNNHVFTKNSAGKIDGFTIKAPTYESQITKID